MGKFFLAQVGVFRDDLNYKSLEELCHCVLSLSVTIKGVSNDYRYTDIVSSHVFIKVLSQFFILFVETDNLQVTLLVRLG